MLHKTNTEMKGNKIIKINEINQSSATRWWTLTRQIFIFLSCVIPVVYVEHKTTIYA